MSKIFGYISRSGIPIREGLAQDMMQASAGWKPDHTTFVELPHAVLGALILHTTTESINEVLPYTCLDSGLTITADARIDNRDELSSMLGLTNHTQTADSIFILHAYQKWGNECGKYLLGDYAFAIWNSRNRELFCARDHIGARSLFYYIDQDQFIFATDPKTILVSGKVPTQITEDWIANILVGIYPAKDQAPFEQMKKLPPAHYLTVTPTQSHIKQYWDLDVTREVHYKREQDYYDHMHALIEQAIRRCTRSAFPVGAELSGGLDSSGIAAFAHAELKKRGEELSTFSHVLPDWALGKIYPFNDEKPYIQALCDYTGITKKYFITAESKGILDEFRLGTERFGYPTGYVFPVFCDALYEKAQSEGIKILLSGFPGDELVTSQGTEFFNELLHHHQYLTLWHELYERNHRKYFKTIYTLVSRIFKHYMPSPFNLLKSYQPTKSNWQDSSFKCCVATGEYIKKMHLYQRLYDATSYPIFNNVRARERIRITEKFVSHRLEQCAAHATYYHLEYRNPFSDRDLIEYTLALPTKIKIKNSVKRYPYRMAISGMVPIDIQWRNDKAGATIPTVHMRYIKDSTRMDELLQSITVNMLFPPYIDSKKMSDIKLLLDHRHKGDALYPHSFYNAWMVAAYDKRLCPAVSNPIL